MRSFKQKTDLRLHPEACQERTMDITFKKYNNE
jgi:hypothetical protein